VVVVVVALSLVVSAVLGAVGLRWWEDNVECPGPAIARSWPGLARGSTWSELESGTGAHRPALNSTP
jgi:hypothetical protein